MEVRSSGYDGRKVVVSVDILHSQKENKNARRRLRARQLDFTSPWIMVKLRRAGIVSGVSVGDAVKSWDVLRALEYIEENVPKEGAILDIGAYASELICALHRLGYSSIVGVDLNPKLSEMPFAEAIQYKVGDFMETPFPDATFDAVTAISVIEHGFRGEALLSELARVLKPNGVFLASVDYWPEKIDTGSLRPFEMDWCIFSAEELQTFIDVAEEYGLHSVGKMNFSATKPVITWRGLSYTFAMIVLQKRP
jgi:SAM-dependent methyltransferase